MIDRVYLWPVSIYSITMVNATVVRLSVVYMGTFTPLTDAIEASFQEVHIQNKSVISYQSQDSKYYQKNVY